MIGSEMHLGAAGGRRRARRRTPCSTVPAPASCRVTPGWSRATAATARSIGATWSLGVVGVAAQRDLDEHGPAAARSRAPACRAGPVTRARPRGARSSRRSSVGGRGGGRGGVARADEELLGRGLLEAGGVDPLVGAGGLAGAGLGVGSVFVPAIPPANTQPTTKSSHRAMVVFGRRAAAPAARRTARASAPSGEGFWKLMPGTVAAPCAAVIGVRHRPRRARPRPPTGVYPRPWDTRAQPCASPSRPPTRTPPGRSVLAVWKEADEIELFESGWTFDHFYPIVGDRPGPCLEGWTMLTALAQATTRLRLGTLVTGIHYRHPAVLANMAATLDIISERAPRAGHRGGLERGGIRRLRHRARRPRERSDRFEEACEVLVGLLSQETTDFDGELLPAARRPLRAEGAAAAAPADLHRWQRREAHAAHRRPVRPALEPRRRLARGVRAQARRAVRALRRHRP